MSFNIPDILLLMAIILFFAGTLSLAAGIIVLLSHTMNKDIRTLAVQTGRLAQKGIIDDIAGLVGSASTLINAANQLVRTSAGVGVFLILISFVLIGASLIILTQIL